MEFHHDVHLGADGRAGECPQSVGLMQVMPATGKWFARKLGTSISEREQLFDPERNIRTGAWYIGHLVLAIVGILVQLRRSRRRTRRSRRP